MCTIYYRLLARRRTGGAQACQRAHLGCTSARMRSRARSRRGRQAAAKRLEVSAAGAPQRPHASTSHRATCAATDRPHFQRRFQ